MFAKLVVASFLALASLTLATSAQAAPPRTEVRELNQDRRILRGVANGSLTAGETARLVAEQRRVDRMQRRMRADDGHLGPAERARLEHAQDRASRHIAVAKHNRRAR